MPKIITVLVLEDQLDIQELLVLALTAKGFSARGASTAADAVQHVASDPPTFLLTDVHLSQGGSGYSAARQLRLMNAKTKIIVMSGQPIDEAIVQQLGVAAWLRKPLDIDVLVSILLEP